MLRSLLLVVPFAWIPACTTPPLAPLPLHDAFPTRYEGGIHPAIPGATAQFAPSPAKEPAKPPATGLPGDGASAGSASVRAWLVQLPLAEARAELANWAKTQDAGVLGFGIGGHHVDRATLFARVAAWEERGAVLSQPFLVAQLGKRCTMRMAKQTAAISGFQLRQGESALMLDPDVQSFEHGTEIGFVADRRGEDVVVTLDWQHSELLRPRTIASVHGGLLGSMEVPVQMRHRLTGETKVAPLDAIVLGVVPTSTPDTVLLLCLETDTTREPVAAVAGPR